MNTDHIGMLRPKTLQRHSGHHGEGPTLSAAQVAQLSGISRDEVSSLIDHGVLKPIATQATPMRFDAQCVMTLQHADEMRRDLLLDSHAFALAVMFLTEKDDMEAKLRAVDSELRACREQHA
jgi:predicted site-specific integrase-resolvase